MRGSSDCLQRALLILYVLGQIGGHEGIGEVIKHGPGVKFPEIGTNVGIKWAADACLACGKHTPASYMFSCLLTH